MNRKTSSKLLALSLCASLGAATPMAAGEDIDVFTGASAGTSINPRILIVLDNTSNWSRQNQQWPGGKRQGQSEVDAINTVIRELTAATSVGLMEYVTVGTAGQNGGFIRFAVKPMTEDADGVPGNKSLFGAQLDIISGDVTATLEKRNSNTPYGNLMYDTYNYLAGANSFSPGQTLEDLADEDGYATAYTRFASPLSSSNICGKTFVIFIGNPNSSGPAADTSDNTTLLNNLNDNRRGDGTIVPVTQLPLPLFNSASVSTEAPVGTTQACYASPLAAQVELASFQAACNAYTDGCKIGEVTANVGPVACAPNTSLYEVIGTNTIITNVATDSSVTDTKPYNADEWVRMMHDRGIPVPGSTIRPSVITYTIDVHNAQPNAEHTSLLLSMAKVGGGKYYMARNEQAIVDALREIMVEIQAVNSTFAATSLPVNATNRSQNENQVFIGMFRPDPNALPRWFGNLKQFKLQVGPTGIELADAADRLAVNNQTGFLTDCAKSVWTVDSGTYWQNRGLTPDPASLCTLYPSLNRYSDAPDGPFVEKGGAAQIVRQGNFAGDGTPTNLENRDMYTFKNGAFVEFNAANSGLDETLVKFIRGEEVVNSAGTGFTRPSIHGDVIHSRPRPVNYGTINDVKVMTVFYGANDGTLRAVDAATGVERWSLVAPEFYPRLNRLMFNLPAVNYPTNAGVILPNARPKDYFFDGSIGVYQSAVGAPGAAKVWIYPTMRRGGRMLYGIDASNPEEPRFLWRAGCTTTDDATCTVEGIKGIGQTWSSANVAFIKGYDMEKPVVLVGGGYDTCEDQDTKFPSCASTKGGFIYILDGETGAILASFRTERAVPADIAMADIDGDGAVDYAYAADTGGNLYRVDFIDSPLTRGHLPKEDWTHRKVAFTTGGGRKFLFAPAVLGLKTVAYLAIGSGDRERPLERNYPYAGVENRFYVYKDELGAADNADAVDLDSMTDVTTANTCTTAPVTPASTSHGWFMKMNQYGPGEQVVTSALIAGGMVAFSTNRPIPNPSASCATKLGQARGYWVNLLNGSGAIETAGTCGGRRSSVLTGGGLPPSPVLANVQVGDKWVTAVLGAARRDGTGDSSPIGAQDLKLGIKAKRKRTYSYTSGD